jgi:MarR family 2-MHQ and catechol resistance regulon transcriptional repressor
MKPGPRYAASLELLRASETLWNAGRVFLERWNLSPSQFNVLNLLFGEEEGCTQTELSRELLMHRSNVTGLVDRLEARGLARRKDSLTDRRVFNVVITDAGTALMRQIYPHYYRAAEALWGEMPVERAAELASEIATISSNAGRIAAKANPERPKGTADSDQA